MQPEMHVDWRRALRLARQTAWSTGWQAKAGVAAAVLILTFVSLPFVMAPTDGDDYRFASAEFVMLVTFGFYVATGILNEGWRYLPVTLADRRAAAWINVVLVPLILSTATILLACLIRVIVDRSIDWYFVVALIGIHSLIVSGFAFAFGAFANWPASMAWFRQPGNRQLGDWLIWVALCVLIGVTALWHPAAQTIRDLGVPTLVASILLCAVSLPVYLSVVRLDPPAKTGGSSAMWSPLDMRLGGGWPGHIAREVFIATLMFGTIALFGTIFYLAQSGGSIAADGDGSDALIVGTLLAFLPIFSGTVMSIVGATRMLQSRRVVLSLPHGTALLLVPTLIHFAVGLVGTLLLLALLGLPLPDGTFLLACAPCGFAIAAFLFNLLLRATTYLEVMLPSTFIGAIAGGVGIFLAVTSSDQAGLLHHAALLALIGVVLSAVTLFWALRQIRHSRRPYRPWPISQSRWKTG